jgi:hypothetical protein
LRPRRCGGIVGGSLRGLLGRGLGGVWGLVDEDAEMMEKGVRGWVRQRAGEEGEGWGCDWTSVLSGGVVGLGYQGWVFLARVLRYVTMR